MPQQRQTAIGEGGNRQNIAGALTFFLARTDGPITFDICGCDMLQLRHPAIREPQAIVRPNDDLAETGLLDLDPPLKPAMASRFGSALTIAFTPTDGPFGRYCAFQDPFGYTTTAQIVQKAG